MEFEKNCDSGLFFVVGLRPGEPARYGLLPSTVSSTASLRTNVEALTLIDNDVRRLIDLDADMDDGEKRPSVILNPVSSGTPTQAPTT